MQILGLADSTPKSTSRLRDLFWPDLTSEPGARSACETASWACFIVAGVTGVAAFWTSKLGLVDAALFLMIGFGLRRIWRTAAVAGLLLYLLEQVATIAQGIFPGVLAIFVSAILFNSVRASFAYRRIRTSVAMALAVPPVSVESERIDREGEEG